MPRTQLPELNRSLATSNPAPKSPACGQPVVPHGIEHQIHRHLTSHPSLRFSSLVIRRVPDGVLLEGFLEADDSAPDLCEFVQSLAGVSQVHNHLVVRSCGPAVPPPKG